MNEKNVPVGIFDQELMVLPLAMNINHPK